MGTGAKIAIGCGALIVVTGIAGVVGVIGLGMWTKSKLEGFTAVQEHISALEKKANENPFTEPDNGVLDEARLVKFLAIRKRVHPTYQKYAKQLESKPDPNKQPDISDVSNAMSLVGGLNELRGATMQALVDEGMSQDEYQFLIRTVYKTLLAAELRKTTGGRTMADATEDAMKEAARALEQQAAQTPDPSLPPEAQKAIREAQEQMKKQQHAIESDTAEAKEKVEDLDVPAENIALFKKYEGEIKQYAMTGLEFLGL